MVKAQEPKLEVRQGKSIISKQVVSGDLTKDSFWRVVRTEDITGG